MFLRTFILKLLLIGVVLFSYSGAFINVYSQEEDIQFLIIDETKTPWGHRFYQLFSQTWRTPRGIPPYFIYIKESKISISRKQSWIYVSIGNNIFKRTVFVSKIKPSSLEIEQAVMRAVKKCQLFLLKDYPMLYNMMQTL